MRDQVLQLLKQSGFVLSRTKNHHVWKNGTGQTWVTPRTPSDHHAWGNNLASLKQMLQRGQVRIAPPINGNVDTAVLDALLRPRQLEQPRAIPERQRGVLAHRIKPCAPVVAIPTCKPERDSELASIYEVGSFLRCVIKTLLDELEADTRRYLTAQTEAFLAEQWARAQADGIVSQRDNHWVAYRAKCEARTEHRVHNTMREYLRAGAAAAKIFQTATRRARSGDSVEKTEVIAELVEKLTALEMPEHSIEPLTRILMQTCWKAMRRCLTLKQGERPKVILVMREDRAEAAHA